MYNYKCNCKCEYKYNYKYNYKDNCSYNYQCSYKYKHKYRYRYKYNYNCSRAPFWTPVKLHSSFPCAINPVTESMALVLKRTGIATSSARCF